MRRRSPLANRDLIFGARSLASSIDLCIQVSCSCGLTALAPIPASERAKPYLEQNVIMALSSDERDAILSFRREHRRMGHETTTDLALVGI